MEHKLRKIYFTIVIVLAILAGVAAIVFAAGFDVKTTAADAGIHTFFGIAYWTCVIFAAIAILGMLGFALLQIIVNLKEQLIRDKVFDSDFTGVIYPKYIKVVSGVEVINAELTLKQ
jgi:uncharacterized BrkB/YihY/UPF0761 family membrane protein